ncbi:ribosomal protein S18 [Phyllosticta paracitricarpa]|uniref:Small ribosomal subunit protein bS18m n=2 Tax=Phyllosticta TaxID=121621 RepID=A0ABR1MN81_9PEZI
MVRSRVLFKPLQTLPMAPVRAFSTSRAALQSGSHSNSAYSIWNNQSAERNSESQNSAGSSEQERGQARTDYSYMMAQRARNSEALEQDRQHRTKSNFMTRLNLWKKGDVYAPHDLTGAETSKWRDRRRATPTSDAFDTLALDPLKEYKNFSILSNYMSDYGRIRHSKATGLKPKNQRKMAKAIRRAIGLGIMPSVHAHPESIWNTSKVVIDKA